MVTLLETASGASAAVGRTPARCYDVAVVGAGMAGMATAARLQAAGLSTVVLEAHGQPGGCAGYFTRRGFSFDVGATTLVDFGPGGLGGDLLAELGLPSLEGEALPGYKAWLPDRLVELHRDPAAWARERLQKLGARPEHVRCWALLDRLAEVFWTASRRGIRLPIRNLGDLWRAARLVGPAGWVLGRHAFRTLGDALRSFGLRGDAPLCGLLSMLVEDTVHATIDEAPLVNAALGVTIRGAGLSRARGGMRGFWRRFVRRYRSLGGDLRTSCRVLAVEGREGAFRLRSSSGEFRAGQVVSAVPVSLTAGFGPPGIREALAPFVRRDAGALGGALVVFLGVPEEEVDGEAITHHQLLQSYERPLGEGNNMFVSVSGAGDVESAPEGFRSVMISTHCEVESWRGLDGESHADRKRGMAQRLLQLARRVYPRLGERAAVLEAGTPQTYERFTSRPGGSVGGYRLSLKNANQHAVPHDVGVPGFWLAGDTTWPGLGTVACVLGSRIVGQGVLARAARKGVGSAP